MLGVMPDVQYEIETIQLEQGDCLIFYTDGLIDAVNFDGDLWKRETDDLRSQQSGQLLRDTCGQEHPAIQTTIRRSGKTSRRHQYRGGQGRATGTRQCLFGVQRTDQGAPMTTCIVTIDGPAASGKSTVAKRIAQTLGCAFLDTGAMYRAVTLACMQAEIDLENVQAIIQVMDSHTFAFDPAYVRIDDQDVSDAIRTPHVTDHVKYIANAPDIRTRLVDLQRAFAQTHPVFVTEGRDQGTVAFPHAQVKIFLTADPVERAKRRLAELHAKGLEQDLDSLVQAVISRDRSDEQRADGPLKPADDAIHVDTTGLSLDEVVSTILGHIRQACPEVVPSEAS